MASFDLGGGGAVLRLAERAECGALQQALRQNAVWSQREEMGDDAKAKIHKLIIRVSVLTGSSIA